MREELLFLALVLAGAAIGFAVSSAALHMFPHL
jgi:hypothetical protein